MNKFLFHMNQAVKIAVSGEEGVVVGRAEYDTAENNYFVRYRSADGRAIEQWWSESALLAA